MSGKGRPIHFTDRKLNEKPSPAEPSKSYEETPQYLDDDYILSASERFHYTRGDMYTYEPHPSSLGPGAAAARLVSPVGKKRATHRAASIPGDASHPSTIEEKESATIPASSRANEMDLPNLARQFRSPTIPGRRKDSFRKKIQSFDDIDTLHPPSVPAEPCLGDGEYQSDVITRSPTSCPSFTSISKANRGGRNESYASAISALTEDFEPGSFEGDSMSYTFSGDKHASGCTRAPKKLDDSEISMMLSSSSITREGSVRSRQTHVGRKQAKWHAKKRARARDIRLHALSGSHEFGHDSGLPAGGDALEHEVDSKSFGEDDTLDSLRGKRAERVHDQLRMARTTHRLFLKDLNLTSRELPTTTICSSPLGAELHKLCLAGNHLKRLPDMVTQNLTRLRTLDLQQCKLVSLPDYWDLPNLKRLDLSHNLLKAFFAESALLGLPKLEHLDMSNNGICEVSMPNGCESLEYLDLAFNDISHLPEDLLQLEKLTVLRISNNYISHVPEAICRMPLSELDVTANPLIQPPTGDCERGIDAMRRYYLGLNRKQKRRTRKIEKDTTKRPKTKSAIGGGGIDVGNALLSAPPTNATNEEVLPRMQHVQASNAVVDQVRLAAATKVPDRPDTTVYNDTLKVIFVGASCSGKTTTMNRLKYGLFAKVPKREERTIGVNIDMFDPKEDCAKYSIDVSHIDTRIVHEDASSGSQRSDIKLSMWDFAGQDVYHATHEVFFSQTSLYVLVWDMAANNEDVRRRTCAQDTVDDGPFQWNDSSDEEDDDHVSEQDARRADRALEHDIDEKVQYWVDCIRSSIPGAVILPVATFDDCFDSMGGAEEAKRRCDKMKERLLNRERRRIESLRKRLEKLESEKRANTAAAMRLKGLLSQYRLPKFIFSDGPDSVIRVSGKFNSGFEELRRKLIHVATGKDRCGMDYPLFRGHVGSAIPPLRIKIRDLVREKRANFQVVEWDYWRAMLTKSLGCSLDKNGLDDAQISDALLFLSSVGEISYFGEALSPPSQYTSPDLLGGTSYDSSGDEDEDDGYVLVPDYQRDESAGWAQESSKIKLSGLSQFIFINPMWLAATLRCVLRHDLRQQLDELLQTKEQNLQPPSMMRWRSVGRGDSFHDASLRCPIISANEARMLWESKGKIAKSARRATLDTAEPKQNAFEFMLRLLVHFGVFVPIDSDTDEMVLDGEVYVPEDGESGQTVSMIFFLPSQLKPWEEPSSETWTYKTKDVGRTCLCQTWLFPDGAPAGLEHLTAEVLRTLHDATSCVDSFDASKDKEHRQDEKGNGQLSFRRILSWKTAFKIEMAKTFVDVDGDLSETLVEIWTHLVDQGSPSCIASETTGVGMKRLNISAKGQEGGGCRNIWEGGYDLVTKAADCVIKGYRGMDFTKQGVCPECLETKSLCDAAVWNWTLVQDAVNGPGKLWCKNGHDVDVRHVACGHHVPTQVFASEQQTSSSFVPYSYLCAGVVLVGLWDGEQCYVCRAGTGFVVDKRYGLIVTAAHNVIDLKGADEAHGSLRRSKSRYYGLKKGRAVIGVVPGDNNGQRGDSLVGPEACFRYFAEIVAEDIDSMDACVLKITGRMQNDVGNCVHECGTLPISPLPGREDIENEGLHQLQVSGRCELEEQVRLLGFAQGGEGLVPMGFSLNRALEVVKGDLVKKYRASELYHGYQVIGHHPRYEIVINCPRTIVGQSGCPCVNQSGQVIGILSRADPADKQRCYLVPTREFMELATAAKSWED